MWVAEAAAAISIGVAIGWQVGAAAACEETGT